MSRQFTWFVLRHKVVALIEDGLLVHVMPSLSRLISPWLRRAHVLLRPDRMFRYKLHLGIGLSSRPGVTLLASSHTRQMWVSRTSGGDCLARAALDVNVARAALAKMNYPLVSCLMVTRERPALAQRAVECFRRQTYPHRELVIVDDDACDDLERWVNALHDPQIQYIKFADEGKPLGELRNLSLQSAQGEYVAQWDDDDLSHPDRLLLQMSALNAFHGDASFLHRYMLWRPGRRCLGVSARTLAENTVVVRKEKIGGYPPLRKGEDTPLCLELMEKAEVVLCDMPMLYIYMFHDNNAWDEEHFEEIWQRSSAQYTGVEYDRVLSDLQNSYATTLVAPGSSSDAPVEEEPAPKTSLKEPPSLLVLMPLQDVAPDLRRLVRNLEATDYPQDRLSLAFLDGSGDHGAYAGLEEMLPELRQRYARVELFKHDFDRRNAGLQGFSGDQLLRRSISAKSRNLLLFSALRDEQWVLWVEVGLLSWPADAFMQMLAADGDIVVPHCVKPDGETFDLGSFIMSEDAEQLDWSRYVCDGLLCSPEGYGRRYLREFQTRRQVALDSVGGEMLLVRADVHRQGLMFPAYSDDGLIGSEAFAKAARAMGYKIRGLPQLTVVHQ